MGHMQTLIWNSYTNKIFRNVEYTATSIIETFKTNLKKSLHCFLLAMKQKAYVPKRWTNQNALPKATENDEDDGTQMEIVALLKKAIQRETKRAHVDTTPTPIPNTALR